jgi:hypothetical protein
MSSLLQNNGDVTRQFNKTKIIQRANPCTQQRHEKRILRGFT